ncbi:uncharacterized protein TNCV_1077041 [Trichonephila clavipes]|uniref:Uncharacterized protein n=1 Tax=Trichonephila clavipes TaxID=2585209 RepID=A0A8X6V2Z4_TRICX|nr:uncharacterized protein TNCV_1077041 [Trichonephila clavipes]
MNSDTMATLISRHNTFGLLLVGICEKYCLPISNLFTVELKGRNTAPIQSVDTEMLHRTLSENSYVLAVLHETITKSPGLSVQCRSSRAHQTTLARLRSGHLRSMTFVQGVKSFFTCPCSLPASPAHLLDCWGISLRQLYEEQGLVCETITRKGQMDFAFLLQGDWKQQQLNLLFIANCLLR